MSEFVTIRMKLHTGFVGGTHEDTFEHPKDDWDEMSEEEKEEFLHIAAHDFMCERVECYAEVV